MATNLEDAPPGLIVGRGSPLYEALLGPAREGRLVFVAGLPGTGKSLLIHQLAHLAHALGRRVHLLQWDVARPVFESSGPGRRYPQDRGVTHGVIRLAVGEWARDAVSRWHERHAGPEHLLVGETPFVGHRLAALARPRQDRAEGLLADPSTCFVIPVPSAEVRRHLEGERERRAERPLHPREQEDAPPAVLRDLWRQLATAARDLGIAFGATAPGAELPYDPGVYAGVYGRSGPPPRPGDPAGRALPTSAFSVYRFLVPVELAPSRRGGAGHPEVEACSVPRPPGRIAGGTFRAEALTPPALTILPRGVAHGHLHEGLEIGTARSTGYVDRDLGRRDGWKPGF
jgi:hypothetical protein